MQYATSLTDFLQETTWDLPQILAWQRVNLDSEGNVIMPGEGVASDGDEGDVEGEEYAESDEGGPPFPAPPRGGHTHSTHTCMDIWQSCTCRKSTLLMLHLLGHLRGF